MDRIFSCSKCGGKAEIRVANFRIENNMVRVQVPICTSLSCLIASGATVLEKVYVNKETQVKEVI